jgi:hypothetical protein
MTGFLPEGKPGAKPALATKAEAQR